MKKGLIALGVVVLLLFMIGGWFVSANNSLVTLDEGVSGQWAQVENQYQRRADLIPNLVNTVKGYAKHEQGTLEGVISARARATQVTIDPTKLDAKSMAEYQQAQGQLSQALGRLMMITENYPQLKADASFRDLQAQLEGTENRIATERGRFNDSAKKFNTAIRKFPTTIVASMFGFEKKAYFEAEEGAKKAPEVNF